jgi:hypothetical protein
MAHSILINKPAWQTQFSKEIIRIREFDTVEIIDDTFGEAIFHKALKKQSIMSKN